MRELEDRESIRECVARYGFNADLGLADAYVDGFAPEGRYETGAGGTFEGHAQLRQLIAAPDLPHKREVESRGSEHTSPNLFIRIEGDTAWAEGYSVLVVRTGENSYGIYTAGYNRWEFKRDGDRWRITLRRRVDIGDVHRPGGTWGGCVMTGFQQYQ